MRLALARTLYLDADIVLMDDCLAALDAHVAQHIWDKALCGYLGDKTRVSQSIKLVAAVCSPIEPGSSHAQHPVPAQGCRSDHRPRRRSRSRDRLVL